MDMTQFAVLNSTRKAGNIDMLHMYTLHAYKNYLEMSLFDMHGHTWINVPYSFDKERSIIFFVIEPKYSPGWNIF